jgi:hypothetical protein
VAEACECGDEPSGSINAGNFLTSCKPVSFSRRTLHHGVSIGISWYVVNSFLLHLAGRREFS